MSAGQISTKPRQKRAGFLPLLFISGAFICGADPAFAQAASQHNAPPNVAYGAWTKICSVPPGTPNTICELTHTARAKDRPDISFRVSFIKLPQSEGTLLRVIVPIRVELPLGVGIKIDSSKDMGGMPYRRSLGESCVAEVLLSGKDMQNFLEGKSATFFVFPTPEEGVGGIIDLTGVKAGYNALP